MIRQNRDQSPRTRLDTWVCLWNPKSNCDPWFEASYKESNHPLIAYVCRNQQLDPAKTLFSMLAACGIEMEKNPMESIHLAICKVWAVPNDHQDETFNPILMLRALVITPDGFKECLLRVWQADLLADRFTATNQTSSFPSMTQMSAWLLLFSHPCPAQQQLSIWLYSFIHLTICSWLMILFRASRKGYRNSPVRLSRSTLVAERFERLKRHCESVLQVVRY